jgi:hypothetical protein
MHLQSSSQSLTPLVLIRQYRTFSINLSHVLSTLLVYSATVLYHLDSSTILLASIGLSVLILL